MPKNIYYFRPNCHIFSILYMSTLLHIYSFNFSYHLLLYHVNYRINHLFDVNIKRKNKRMFLKKKLIFQSVKLSSVLFKQLFLRDL